jgi:2-oxoglutarate ferredoxin oxidoreductase subunit alpha
MSPKAAPERVNDFVIKIGTVNGTGSASANGLLMKAVFRSGVPVVGKNYFPSNIQGAPTWYEIRVTRAGYRARAGQVDIMVALNPESYARDLQEVVSGGYFVYDCTWPRPALLARRDDVTVLGVPLARLCNENFQGVRTRILMKNICYAGVLAALCDLDLDVIRGLLAETYAKKPQLVESNMKAIQLGYDYARAQFDCPLPLRVAKMDATKGHIIIDGNTAAGLGCVYAGATVGAWYPITPSTSLMDAYKSFAERLRTTADGRKNYVMIQAEDELASIGMVIGANWNGARAFTATSGPGISLMQEFLGLGYYTETPAVVFDVQRVGPSTGMPTRTQQSDLRSAAYASHGDTRHVCLYPANPEECFYFAAKAFDLADRLQTPVLVLSDLDIGMNDWMCPDLKWDENYQPDRGKLLDAEQLSKIDKFWRYYDHDDDGIPQRTLPGVSAKGAWFARGSGHTQYGAYTEDSRDYQIVLDRLRKKWLTAARLVPKAIIETSPGAEADGGNELAIVTVGSGDAPVREAIDRLRAQGVHVDYMRVRGFPFGEEVESFLNAHRTNFIVEQNRDAQLRALLLLETGVEKGRMRSILHYNGMPLASSYVVDGVMAAVQDRAHPAAKLVR